MANAPLINSLIPTFQKLCFEGKLSEELSMAQLAQWGLGAWTWYCLHDSLSEPELSQAQRAYAAASAFDLKQEMAFRHLSALFEKNMVRYCPLKGADLAWRVYPTGALRSKGDLDIFVHPDDYKTALNALQKDGWNVPYHTSCSNHFPPMIRQNVSLELHFKLPCAERVDSPEIWKQLHQINGCHYQLPLELNLLMLFQHCRQHRWEIVVKLLFDSAFLIRKEGVPDWKRIEMLAQRFQIASPALFFAAFPDFFPAEALPPYEFPQHLCQTFRELLFSPMNLAPHKSEIIMSREDRFSLRWFLERLRGMRPGSIRSQTHNPRGHYGKLLAGYWTVSKEKLRTLWRYRHGTSDPALKKRLVELERLEKQLLPPSCPQKDE